MPELDYDLKKTLEWCAANEVAFQVENVSGLMAITARRGNIYAQYVIDEPYDALRLGNALWAALFSVKHGSGFHDKYGPLPPVADGGRPEGDRRASTEGGEGEGGSGGGSTVLPPVPDNAPPNLRTNTGK